MQNDLMGTHVGYVLRCFSLLFALLAGCGMSKDEPAISANVEGPQIDFAIEELRRALKVDGPSPFSKILFQLSAEDEHLQAEGYSIRNDGSILEVSAIDTAGLMYGGLELAEQIRLFGSTEIKGTIRNPYMEMRGTKFNIPLDVRTPSYSHASDAAQKNLPHMWDFEFWKAYIDALARYRYNFISLWSLHPFPSLVKVPDYPNVALDDVHRSTTKWEEYYSLGAIGLDTPEILNNPEVVRRMSIEEKIAFWNKVMRYGKSRNVDFYFVTWNIFVNGTGGQYGITTDADNAVTKDYFRKSILELFRAYPDLAGIGLTTGENMKGLSFEEKEDWAFDTYGMGMLDVAREMPDRRFTFIHRQHQADPQYIEQKFAPVLEQENVEFIYSFKYAKAHVFSATEQPYHDAFVQNIGSLKTIWTLRNDDAYFFRWGAPEFVREFIQNIPYEVSKGVYYGSDQWIWGRDFTSRHAGDPGQLEVEKHWYHWMMWGRLSYNPTMANDRFVALLGDRFPEIDADALYRAWHAASMVYPLTTGFHWGRVDFHWYIEGCRSRPENARNETGFHDVEAFIFYPVHEKSGNQSIPEFVEMTLKRGSSDLRSPLEVSAQLHTTADEALALLNDLDHGDNTELLATLRDIRTVAYMGKYYAHKIAGSTYVALYRKTRDDQHRRQAIEELTEALDQWERYVDAALIQNHNPIWTNRVGHVDWARTTEWVRQDIEIAKAKLPKN